MFYFPCGREKKSSSDQGSFIFQKATHYYHVQILLGVMALWAGFKVVLLSMSFDFVQRCITLLSVEELWKHNIKVRHILYLVQKIVQHIWKPLFGSGPLQLTSWRCISVIRVCFSKGCACEIVMKRAECWNAEETPRMNPEGPSDNRPLSHVQNAYEGCVSWERPLAVRGLGMWGVLRGASGRGRQSRGTRPRWMSGQHLFHLLAGSYQHSAATHTGWEKGAFFA